MLRRYLPRFVLRGPKRAGGRLTARGSRCAHLEQLDSRLVLSGLSVVTGPEAASEHSGESHAAVVQVQAVTAVAVELEPSRSQPCVYLADDGVLHVEPVPGAGEIVVRQFMDFQGAEVIEIEMAGRWTAFAAGQVGAIEISAISDESQWMVAAGVTKPVTRGESLGAVEAPVASRVDGIVADLAECQSSTITDTVASLDGPLMESLLFPPPDVYPETYLLEMPGIGPGTATLTPPRISDFAATQENGVWQISGQVTDDKSVAGLTVKFGGLLQGLSVVVNEQGYFQITKTFPPGTFGGVTAETTDRDGMMSNMAYCVVNYPG